MFSGRCITFWMMQGSAIMAALEICTVTLHLCKVIALALPFNSLQPLSFSPPFYY